MFEGQAVSEELFWEVPAQTQTQQQVHVAEGEGGMDQAGSPSLLQGPSWAKC